MDIDAITQRLQAGELYSQAGNFLSHVSTGVDARTGQFTLACSLPDLQANDLAGPLISPALQFSPLHAYSNSGLGLGWSMTFAQLDLNTGQLRMGTGDSFQLDRDRSDFAREGVLAFHDQKLLTFQVIADDDEGRRFRVEHKDGITEYLEVQDRSPFAMLVEIRSPEGRQVHLQWLSGNGPYLLWNIRDEQRELLSVRWLRGEVHFDVFPESATAATFTLNLINGQLTDLILPDGDSRWTFEYEVDQASGLLFPSRVQGPLGSIDEVTYASGAAGHQLPAGAPLAYLPRVLNHRHDPGAGQPALYKAYEWIGNYNFLGFGADILREWQAGQDNLYLNDRYEYSCVETALDEQGTTLLSVERTWNRFHLQTRELTLRGATSVEVLTVYGEDRSVGWEDQPAWCQLPVATITRYARGDAFREERSDSEYDAYGNVLYQRTADIEYQGGQVAGCAVKQEHWREYYPLDGAEGCPCEGETFVRWLKCHTVTQHAADAEMPNHTAFTRYGYTRLSKRRPQDRQHLVLNRESAFEWIDGVEVPSATIEQATDQDIDSPFHGRVLHTTTTYNGFATTTHLLRTLEDGVLYEVQQRQSHDPSLVVSASTRRHTLTGLTLEECNEHGVVTCYEHDLLGRAVRRVESAGSAYAAITTNHYQLPSLEGATLATVTQTDSNGQQRRITLDGLGREIAREVQDLDSAGAPLREIRRVEHDALGNVVSETTCDWLPDEPIALCVSTVTTAYDDWGTLCRTVRADGTSSHVLNDPILRQKVMWEQSATGEQGTATTLYENRFASVERLDLRAPALSEQTPGELLRCETWVLDARQRPLQHVIETPDGERRVTATAYDRDGRVVERTLQDGSTVKWRFAPHTDGEAITQLSLCAGTTESVLLEQIFDGLDRPLTRTCGTQCETLTYQLGQLPPSSLTRADGSLAEYAYEPDLDYRLVRVERPDEHQVSAFTYSVPEGRLTRTSGGLGELSWDFTPAGETRTEHWHHPGQTFSSEWVHSLGGRVQSFTDVRGEVTHCTYDAIGRLSAQYTGSLAVALTYDGFGRLAQTLTTDTQPGQSQQQTLTYDLLGRECTREWLCHSLADTARFRQTLTWTAHDQVQSRTWETLDGTGAATVLSEEHYLYDARGRLIETRACGPEAVADPRTGQRIRRQVFAFNVLDGYEQVDTEYVNGERNRMTFTYDAGAPDRPVRITHSWPSAQVIDLEYDGAGQLTRERHDGQLWREWVWDSQGHLVRHQDAAGACDYAYDPVGRLVQTTVDDRVSHRFHDGPLLVNEQSDDGWLSLMRAGNAVFAQSRLSQAVRTVLLTGTDGQGSVRVETGEGHQLVGYSAHGLDNGTAQSRVGFAGELREPGSALYIPGGNRPYDPCLMMFLSPDNASPEGAGGLNRYAYCSGDPVNRVDPDGHAWWNWVVAGVGLVLGAVAVAVTAGVAAPAVGAAYTALLGAGAGSMGAAAGAVAAVATSSIAGAIAITSVALESITLGADAAAIGLEASGNEKAAGILGWVSIGGGAASLGLSIGASVAKAASKAERLAGALRPGMYLKRGQRGVPSKFAKLKQVVTQPLDSAPKGNWKSASFVNDLGEEKIIFGTNRPIAGKNLNTPLNFFSRRASVRQREIIVFTGSHGVPGGSNWTLNGTWDSDLLVPGFYHSDVRTHGTAVNGRVTFQNLAGMSEIKFGEYMNSNDAHVILGYCFSMNDQALRYYKNMDPIISYVP